MEPDKFETISKFTLSTKSRHMLLTDWQKQLHTETLNLEGSVEKEAINYIIILKFVLCKLYYQKL